MKCLLVFNNLNDIIFMKNDRAFSKHILKIAKEHYLLSSKQNAEENSLFNADLVMQIFSPLITSQRVMANHFSNGYSYIQCTDKTNIAFEEYMEHLFVYISSSNLRWLKKALEVFVSVVKRVCGPEIALLKSCDKRHRVVHFLLDTWFTLFNTEQFMLIEAVEQLRVNSQLATSTIKTLQHAVERLKSSTEFSNIHALIMVNYKFLSLYSSRNAADLTPGDILFLGMLCDVIDESSFSELGSNSFLTFHDDTNSSDDDDDYEDSSSENGEDCETFYSPDGSHISSLKTSVKSISFHSSGSSVHQSSGIGEDTPDFMNNFVFLLANQKPHIVHISYICQGIPLFLIHEVGNETMNKSLLDLLYGLNSLYGVHARSTVDMDNVRSVIDTVDSSLKKLNEIFKKKLPSHINKSYPSIIKGLIKRWDPIKKKYCEFMKNRRSENLYTVEPQITSMMVTLREMYTNCMLNDSLAVKTQQIANSVGEQVQKSLQNFTEFFKIKATRNFTLASKSTLNINKYLEEFPGLVHFLYVDRITHRLVAPSLDFSSQETISLTKRKIWSMVDFSQAHLQDGRLYIMWKDTVFIYSYFLWFEDVSGTPLKPKISPASVLKNMSMPGILCEDFYQKLIEKCFPKTVTGKVRCFELYSIHLGLVASSCVLEHCRRLTATIWEVTGIPTNPLDLVF